MATLLLAATNTYLRSYIVDGAGDLTYLDQVNENCWSVWGDGTYVYSVGTNGLKSWTVDYFGAFSLIDTDTTLLGSSGRGIWGDGN